MEDLRHKQVLQTMNTNAQRAPLDSTNTQSAHGSPYHVHPYPSPVRLQQAFQPVPNNTPKMFYPKGLRPLYDVRGRSTPQPSPILGRALCLTGRDSPVPGRVSQLNNRFSDSLNLNSDTDYMVTKIGAMFPTVSETHIRILLKKYHNREAVVISALQVEKHPLVTPGPLAMSPSAARFTRAVTAASVTAATTSSAPAHEYYLPFTVTPNSDPSLFRPPSIGSSYCGMTTKTRDGHLTRQHSPKMKLKYLKSIFPKADEMLILDMLSANDNNVQTVSEELVRCGYVKKLNSHKKDAPPAPRSPSPPPPKKEPTRSEKMFMLRKYQKLYPSVGERIICIALETVFYNEELAEQVLATVMEEDVRPWVYEPRPLPLPLPRTFAPPPACAGVEALPRPLPQPPPPPPAPARRPKLWTQPNKSEGRYRPILKTSGGEAKYQSNYNAPRRGPNPHLHRGPAQALLLADYLPWGGPGPTMRGGAGGRASGPAPRPAARPQQATQAHGPASLARGPQGHAKGSMYSKKNNKAARVVPK